MYAMLGEVPFEFLQSFSEWEETHGADYAKHEVLGGRPRLQAVGNDLTKIRFGLKLHWKLGSPDAAYKGLVAAKEAQQALSLVTGAGRFVGWCRTPKGVRRRGSWKCHWLSLSATRTTRCLRPPSHPRRKTRSCRFCPRACAARHPKPPKRCKRACACTARRKRKSAKSKT